MTFSKKTISSQTLFLLKEALSVIYWKKEDLKKFVEYTIKNTAIVAMIDWNNNRKAESASELIERMAKRDDIYHDDLIKLIYEISNINDFSHLSRWDDAEVKIKAAKEAVKKLRENSQGYFEQIEQARKSQEAKQNMQNKIRETQFSQDQLAALHKKFSELSQLSDAQKRGFELERFLNELFKFFELDPKSSFRINGEQIDGAFTFENTDYLIEAKWLYTPVNAKNLYEFGGVIEGKLKNTLGLYVSLGGYSDDAIGSKNPLTKSLILMDGMCLIQVLEGRIKLSEMLYLKRRHASQTGEIFYRVIV